MARWLKEGGVDDPFRFNLSFKPIDHILVADWMRRLPHGHVTQALLQAAQFALEAGFVYVNEVEIKRPRGRPPKKRTGADAGQTKTKTREVFAPAASPVQREVASASVYAPSYPVSPVAETPPSTGVAFVAPAVASPIPTPTVAASASMPAPVPIATPEQQVPASSPQQISSSELDVLMRMVSHSS